MKWTQVSVLAFVFFGSMAAMASVDGDYKCKNLEGLPDNTYKISSLSIGAGGQSLPYIEAARYYREDPLDLNSPVKESRLKGFAAVSTSGTTVNLMVAALRLEFQADKLYGCERQ